ncbi:NYN domain-containing protein [Shewanella gelidii]|uniref:Nuclease n=1 Tax=Shewanella gelidii TaxID=1642821 RepID=A0A917JJT1_9GAMM|nr:NYN domain-containing protein [Shewanella gelidii]MCL1097182.1 NYN domain-containing protein [Shewanella gelidii]GGI73098.1 nuclease [Shewanella gelidii]
MKKVAIFVDVQNVYYTCRQAYQRQFNYRKLWQQLDEQYDIVTANAYAIASQQDGQIKFQDALRHMGFEVKLKPFIQRSDGSAKGDWDVGITIDILESAAIVDEIILLSGDGDFEILLRHIQTKHGTPSQVFGVPSLTANALIQAANQYHAIDEGLLK